MTMLFADDQVVIANNENNLQRAVHELWKINKNYNMEISVHKTKTMAFCGKSPVRSKIVIGNSIIEQIFNAFIRNVSLLHSYKFLLEEGDYRDQKVIGTKKSPRARYIVVCECERGLNNIVHPWLSRGTARYEFSYFYNVHAFCVRVVVIPEDVQNVHLLLEYRPHIDVSLTCEHHPKLQEYCVCPQNMPQFDSEGIPNQAPETNKPMILNGPTSRNREGSDQVSVETKQLGHLYLSIDQETFDPSTGEPYD
ncbi:hypothetical protein ANN_21950 [Periplaneta americana]|uniref:Reverse transcriptase domain-containing protein n=1 Tax=Periplaneta americana TaxID=6978 RepID=A0ABQ8S6T4_PERAM|nr:hypothetical protein ANN_21950 [Periplaneta americana]